MRSTLAAIAVLVLAPAAPAVAQVCDCGPGTYFEDGPAYVVVPRTTYVPHTHYTEETVLVPRTRLVPRVVYVPRTRLERRRVAVPRVTYSATTRTIAYPADGAAFPGRWSYGATYVPPGAAFGCPLGTIGCDSSFVGPLGD